MSYDGTLKFDTKIDTDSFNTGVSKLGSIAKTGLGLATKALGATVAGLGALGKQAYTAGSEYEAGMSEVKAISGATAEEMEKLGDVGLDVAKQSKFTAAQIAEAYKYMGMAGWDAEDMMAGLAGVINLAAAAGEDLGTTSDIVTDGLTAFGLSAEDASHFADVLAAAATSANTNVSMMGDSFKYVAPVIGALYGQGENASKGMEDTAKALGLMANAGIKASSAGTALRSIITRLSSDGKAQDALEKLGTSLYDTEGNARDLEEVLAEARIGWKQLSAEQQTSNAKTIAGQYAMSGWLALMNAAPEDIDKVSKAIRTASGDTVNGIADIRAAVENSGIDWVNDFVFPEKAGERIKEITGEIESYIEKFGTSDSALSGLKKYLVEDLEWDLDDKQITGLIDSVRKSIDEAAVSMENAQGAAQKMADEMLNNLPGALTKLASTFDILKVSVYQDMQTPLKDAVLFAKDQLDILQNAFDTGGLKGLVGSIGEVLANIVGAITEKAPDIIDAAADLMHTFGESMIAKIKELSDSGKIGKLVVSLFTGIGTYLEVFATVGAELIGALGKAITDNAPKLKDSAAQILRNILTAISNNAGDIGEGAASLILALAGAISDNIPLILEVAAKLVAAFAKGLLQNPTALLEAAPALLTFFTGKLASSAVGILGSAGKGLVSEIVRGIASGSGSFSEAITALLNPVKGIGAAFSGIGEVIKTAFSGVASVIGPVITTIGGIAGIVGGAALAVKGFTDMWSDGWNIISTIVEALGLALAAIGAIILGAPAAIAAAVAGVIFALSQLVIVIHDNWEAIRDFFKDLGENIKQTFSDLWDGIKEGFNNAVNALKEAWSGIKDFFGELFDKIKEIFSNLWDSIKQGVSTAIDAVKEAWANIKDFFSELGENVKEIFTRLWDNVKENAQIVIDFLKEAWNGIKDFFGELIEGVKEVFGNLWDHVKEGFSNLLDAVKNIWNTIKDFFSGLIDNIKEIFSSLWEDIKDGVSKAIDAVKDAWGKVKDFFKELGEDIKNIMKELWDHLVTWFEDLIGKIKDTVADIWDSVKTLVSDIIDNVKELFSNIGDFLKELWDNVTGFFSDVLDKAKGVISDVWDAVSGFFSDVIDKLKEVFDSVTEWFKDLIDTVTSSIEELFNGIVEWINNIWDTIKGFFEEAIAFIEEKVGAIWDAIKTAFEDIWEAAKNLVKDVLDGVVDFFKNLWEKVTDGVKGVIDRVKEAFANIKDHFLDVGEDIVKGIWEGIKGAAGWVFDKVSGFVSDMVDKVKDKLGIHSPSKVMAEEVGSYLPAGIVEGFEDKARNAGSELEKGVSSMVKDMTNGMDFTGAHNRAENFFNGLIDMVKNAVSQVIETIKSGSGYIKDHFLEIGKSIAEGIGEGIKDSMSYLYSKVTDMMKSIAAAARSAMQINSPSKVMANQVGKYLPSGIVMGFEDAMQGARLQLEKDVSKLVNGMTAAVDFSVNASVPKAAIAGAEYGAGATVINNYDQHIDQTNNYHEAVPTPSAVAKNQREAVRNLVGGYA